MFSRLLLSKFGMKEIFITCLALEKHGDLGNRNAQNLNK